MAVIREARAGETDAYVRAALEGIISRLSNTADPKSESLSDDQLPDDVLRAARTQAVESVTALLLHEVASPFGLVANAAAREVPQYATSNIKRHIDRVQRIFEGIEQLRSATAKPKRQEFDLAEFILRIIGEECSGKPIQPTTHGPRPLVVTTDPQLLRFAISNGLRNAIEATAQVKSDQPVVITWGKTDVDNWVAVIDQGPGLPNSVDPAFEPGKSTKGKGHSGFGLAIAKQAMETLGGVVTLSPARAGGARYELRWDH
jgi:signal transduction histidine kinase